MAPHGLLLKSEFTPGGRLRTRRQRPLSSDLEVLVDVITAPRSAAAVRTVVVLLIAAVIGIVAARWGSSPTVTCRSRC